jgi:hypothetical protein
MDGQISITIHVAWKQWCDCICPDAEMVIAEVSDNGIVFLHL